LSYQPVIDLPAKTILKERESKPLIEELRRLPSLSQLSNKLRVELETANGDEVVFVDGEPLVFRRKGELIPVLVNTSTLNGLPRVVVDMGAVPHVVAGADVMAPGIRKVQGEFVANQLLGVTDEKHGKYLAIGKALIDSETMAGTKRGKVIENLHYVGDAVWEVVKEFMRQPAAFS
jgi:PUA domain protein